MKIKQIVLYNFGSYEGKNQMVFQTEGSGKNIVLIGGKNGAGKTTFFQALKLCLYGYRETGYQSPNAYYRKKIIKYINNKAKESRPVLAYVELTFEMEQGAVKNEYILRRGWELLDDVIENIEVWRNGLKMDQEELDNFENFLIHIIPPELFNIYFLDGERITDFFIEEGEGICLKDAFTILCGYDNFEIMYRNFKRLSAKSNIQNERTRKYIKCQEELQEKREVFERKVSEEKKLIIGLNELEAELKNLEKNYKKRGGISRREREGQYAELRQLEAEREEYNRFLKNSANELIPFLILRDNLILVKEQIEREEIQEAQELLQYAVQKELEPVLKEEIPEWSAAQRTDILGKVSERLKKNEVKGERILYLSRDEKERIRFQIQTSLQHSVNEVIDAQKAIDDSIKMGAKLKKEIEQTDIGDWDEYISKKEMILKEKQRKLVFLEKVRKEKEESEISYLKAEEAEKKAKIDFEKEAKKSSVIDLSTKGILFLDKLQQKLYISQIHKVEKLFEKKIKQLKRKEKFIDEIQIDENFNIHIYEHNPRRELDISLLSNGEKQIFIMALYWALIQLSRYEVPFVIDTPFARIDTEHRENITNYFFKELKGQVFILSTNKEIEGEHINNLESQIQSYYLLENNQNQRTSVIENKYFGEANA